MNSTSNNVIKYARSYPQPKLLRIDKTYSVKQAAPLYTFKCTVTREYFHMYTYTTPENWTLALEYLFVHPNIPEMFSA